MLVQANFVRVSHNISPGYFPWLNRDHRCATTPYLYHYATTKERNNDNVVAIMDIEVVNDVQKVSYINYELVEWFWIMLVSGLPIFGVPGGNNKRNFSNNE